MDDTGIETSSSSGSLDASDEDAPPRRTTWQLIRNNAMAFSNEFTYSTETALVVPLLLKMNFPEKYYSLTYFLSPLVGFITSPMLGSLSDRCKCSWGRRRPFILGLSFLALFGLTFLLNGEAIGYSFGDTSTVHTAGLVFAVTGQVFLDYSLDCTWGPIGSYKMDVCNTGDLNKAFVIQAVMSGLGGGLGFIVNGLNWKKFNLENYLYREEHSVFIINSLIFIICAITTLTSIKEKPVGESWKKQDVEVTSSDDAERAPFIQRPRSHSWSHSAPPPPQELGWKKIRALNYKEMMDRRNRGRRLRCSEGTTTDRGVDPRDPGDTDNKSDEGIVVGSEDDSRIGTRSPSALMSRYGSMLDYTDMTNSTHSLDVGTMNNVYKTSAVSHEEVSDNTEENELSLKTLFISLITCNMPNPLRHLVASMFFGWLAMCAIYLFFTDFVAQMVFHGSPSAPDDSEVYKFYNDGVKYACWGMCIFSFTTSLYSLVITKLMKVFSIYTLYIWGFIIFAIGTGVIALAPNKITCLVLTFTFGILFTTLYTMPYTLLNSYMSSKTYLNHSPGTTQRTHGVDIGILQSQMFIAMIILSATIGPLVDATGSRLVIPIVASLSGFVGAIHAALFLVFDISSYDRVNILRGNNNVVETNQPPPTNVDI